MTLPLSPISRVGTLCVALSLGVLTVSCDAGAPGPDGEGRDGGQTLAVAPTPVSSPAGPGSAEPHLSSGEDGVVLSWLEPREGDRHVLRMARWTGSGWDEPVDVLDASGLFVNWADFPSVVEVDGTLFAHWLQRGTQGGYDYGVRLSRSGDGGESWTPAWTPHSDGTPTEHGFVSIFPHPGGGAGLVWLDGRRFVSGPDGAEATEEMTLRARRVGVDGTAGPEVLLDDRICDCCQTDAAITAEGPLVVYRDRDAEEVRDIYVTRLLDGAWTDGVPVHEDGWRIPACPVNGPAVAARGREVAVAWFTGAGDTAAVKVAFSGDAGASFAPPFRIDGGRPAGRVDVILDGDGAAVVSWIERVGDGRAELRVRRVGSDGRLWAPSTVSRSSAARAAGFPQMVLVDGELLLAWTDLREDGGQSVATARARLEGS